MTLKERLMDDLKASMKAQDTLRTSVLRMLKAKILEAEVALRDTKGRDYQLDDPETIRVLASYAKQRKESVESYRQGGRMDLVDKEEKELAIVEGYLPRALSEDEIREAVKKAIAATGATSKKELGLVMKTVMAQLQGAADGKLVNRIVNELL